MARVAVFLCVAAAILSGCESKDIARVNASRITRDELAKQLEEDYGHEVLSRIIDRLLVDQAFEQAGLQFPQEKLEGIIQEWRDQAGSEEEFQRVLAMQGRTEEDLRQAVEMGIKMEMLGQKDLKYSETDLKSFYEENELLYDEPERVAFSEIVVQTRKEAEDIYKMATKPGAKFPDLAKQYSIAVSRTKGGQRPPGGREDTLPLEAFRGDATVVHHQDR
jgi:foldase protein PrsA